MKKVSTKEFIWYLACGVVSTFGIILIIFGIIGNHMPHTSYEANFIKQFEDNTNINLRLWGILFLAVGVVVASIVLVVFAKKSDRDVEKRIRREQRLSAQANANIEAKEAVQVIEEPKE